MKIMLKLDPISSYSYKVKSSIFKLSFLRQTECQNSPTELKGGKIHFRNASMLWKTSTHR